MHPNMVLESECQVWARASPLSNTCAHETLCLLTSRGRLVSCSPHQSLLLILIRASHVESQYCKYAFRETNPGNLSQVVLVCETSAANLGLEKTLTN